jgi:hypothetical protein
MHDWYQQTVAVANGKPVWVSETGWPSCGNTITQAVPSPENASTYFLYFVSWARANNVPYFYFEALDESWKANYEGPQGACWGVWNKNGVLKPGMQSVFSDTTTPDHWSGAPTIGFLSVPPYGHWCWNNCLVGHVWHVIPSNYNVAVYIYVENGWWSKPSYGATVPIRVNGNWETRPTTGGTDELATRIRAYLIPHGIVPPTAAGVANLPPELEQYPMAEALRTP